MVNEYKVGCMSPKEQLACAALDGVFFKLHLELAGQWLHQAYSQYETALKKERLSLHNDARSRETNR